MPSVNKVFVYLSFVSVYLFILFVCADARPLPPNPKYNRWANNVIPYVISDEYDDYQKETIRKALDDFENRTRCFTFVEKTADDKDWVDIVSRNGCWSYLGRQGGNQTLSLSGGCVEHSIVQHEMMHAIGIEHEHQRPDRDNHVKVNTNNTEPAKRYNFDINSYDELHAAGFPYDIHSIMHYSGYTFGLRNSNGSRLVTIEDKSTNQPVQYNTKLTDLDIKKIRWIGKCK